MNREIVDNTKLKQDEWLRHNHLTQDQIKSLIQEKIERYAKIRSTVKRVVDSKLTAQYRI